MAVPGHLTSWGKLLPSVAGRGFRHAPAQGVRCLVMVYTSVVIIAWSVIAVTLYLALQFAHSPEPLLVASGSAIAGFATHLWMETLVSADDYGLRESLSDFLEDFPFCFGIGIGALLLVTLVLEALFRFSHGDTIIGSVLLAISMVMVVSVYARVDGNT